MDDPQQGDDVPPGAGHHANTHGEQLRYRGRMAEHAPVFQVQEERRCKMRYNKNGDAILHKLGKDASFSEVVLTVRELGYTIECSGRFDFVKLETEKKDKYGFSMFNSKTVRLDELVEWLNREMVSRNIIKEEVEL
jgi:hypothetical protein